MNNMLDIFSIVKETDFIKGSNLIIFKNNIAFRYNSILSISAPFETDLIGAVDFQSFHNSITDFSTITTNNKEMIIKDGDTEIKLPLVPDTISKYRLNLDLEFTELPPNFRAALNYCIADAFVQDDNMYSADGAQISFYKLTKSMPSFLLDAEVIEELPENITHYADTESWVHFKIGNTVISCRKKNDANYPSKKIIDKITQYQLSNERVYTLPKMDMNKMELFCGGEAEPYIDIVIERDCITFIAENDRGSVIKTIKIGNDNEKIIKFRVNYTFLTDILKKASNFYIKNNNLVFFNEDYLQIISTFR